MKEVDFTTLKIGDKVWDFTEGWGILAHKSFTKSHPIAVRFENSLTYYTKNGRLEDADINPSLFLNEFTIPEIAFTSLVNTITDKIGVDNEKS